MWREEQTTVGKPALRFGRSGDTQGPKQTKNEMEERLGQFHKTLASCRAKREPVEVNVKGLRPTKDIQRQKLS